MPLPPRKMPPKTPSHHKLSPENPSQVKLPHAHILNFSRVINSGMTNDIVNAVDCNINKHYRILSVYQSISIFNFVVLINIQAFFYQEKNAKFFWKIFLKIFIIVHNNKTSCGKLLIIIADLENCRCWVIPKSFDIRNTNIFDDMNIITKRVSSVPCCFSKFYLKIKFLKVNIRDVKFIYIMF